MDAVQAIADPTRRGILRLVWNRELSAGEIAAAFTCTFGAVSQHLGRLREAGLVTVRRDWKRRFYRADKAALGPLAEYLERMWASQLDTLKGHAEAEEVARSRRAAGPGGRTRGEGKASASQRRTRSAKHARPRRRR
ncbi:Transcriptional activator HlyU [Phycisphaerales bacterium]|nr:Transcriptional activator HlyU [Phycisphaerales bacterium]